MTDLPTEVEISKTDITGSNELAGAKLYVVSPNGETIEEWTSTGKTKKISGLPVGKGYKLCEEAAPDGYLTAECVEFEVKENGTSKVEMKDELMKITIVKVDSITGEKLSGAELQLIDPENDNKVLETWTTDGKEYVIKAKLTVGKTYVIKETKVPEGYVSNPVPIEFTVGNTNEIKIENTKPHIEVFKYDKVTGNALKGAHLQLLDDKGKLSERHRQVLPSPPKHRPYPGFLSLRLPYKHRSIPLRRPTWKVTVRSVPRKSPEISIKCCRKTGC